MASERARRRTTPFINPPDYARHHPEATLLYELVERHYPELVAAREAVGRPLPKYVQEEFEAYLKCGRLEHGFLRVRCEDCHAEIVAFSCKPLPCSMARFIGVPVTRRGSAARLSARRASTLSRFRRSSPPITEG